MKNICNHLRCLNLALAQEAADYIEELEAQIEYLKQELLEERASYESQFQRMKCCGNCKHEDEDLCRGHICYGTDYYAWELRE